MTHTSQTDRARKCCVFGSLCVVASMIIVRCAPATEIRTVVVTIAPQVKIAEVTATPVPTIAASQPTTITVCATGCDFTTIQAAIDDLGTGAGSTIKVMDAAHTEAEIAVGKDVTIQGQGADSTIIQAHEAVGQAADRVFIISEGVAVVIRDVTIRHGSPDLDPLIPGIRRSGGGIVNQGILTLEDSVISDNVASAGGAIYNMGTLTVTNCTISRNLADGIDKPGQGCGSGGGIMHLREGPVKIVNSTISDNRGTGKGGGIKTSCAAPMTLINSTISGNSTTGNGGGIYVMGTANLVHCTVSGNSGGAGEEGAGVYIRGTLNITNTLIAGNATGLDCVIGSGDRSHGSIGANINSLIADGSCNPAYSGDPRLDALAANGGDTLTHALLPDSPAIDAVPPGECPVASDQRGTPRPQGASCDIGAFELP